MAKNYYLILGVSPDATPNEIKSAYRRRAREFHPDRFGEERQPFLDIQEAYAALSDSVSRNAYDRDIRQAREVRRAWSATGVHEPEPLVPRRRHVEPLRPDEVPADLGRASLLRSFRTYRPSYEELFDRIERNFRRDEGSKSASVKELVVEFTLTPEEARRGGNVQLHVPARVRCPLCRGGGVIGFYECGRCAGEGVMSGEFPLMLSWPPGIGDGYRASMRLDRLGIGDLFLTVCFRVATPRDGG